MVDHRVILFFVILSVKGCFSSMPISTGYGTTECKLWPSFHLQDYNPASETTYLQLYGLADIQPWSEVTIVGMYFADSKECQDAAVLQEKLGNELLEEITNFTIHNVVLNYYAPMECAKTECISSWSNWGLPYLFSPWYSNTCRDYVGGCPADDARLQAENWQMLLANVTSLPILQDTYWEDAWDRLGGGKGDIFIYDGTGRLHTFFCNDDSASQLHNCVNYLEGGLSNETTYERVKAAVVSAANSNSTERCGTFTDDYYSWNYNYYYYYDDNDRSGDDDDDDDDDDDNVLINSSEENLTPAEDDRGSGSDDDRSTKNKNTDDDKSTKSKNTDDDKNTKSKNTDDDKNTKSKNTDDDKNTKSKNNDDGEDKSTEDTDDETTSNDDQKSIGKVAVDDGDDDGSRLPPSEFGGWEGNKFQDHSSGYQRYDDDDDDDDDDAFFFGDDVGRVHFRHNDSQGMSSFGYASLLALCLALITGTIVYISWKRNRQEAVVVELESEGGSGSPSKLYPYSYAPPSSFSSAVSSYSSGGGRGGGGGGGARFSRLPTSDLDIELREPGLRDDSAYGSL